jgi:hypothetical protein
VGFGIRRREREDTRAGLAKAMLLEVPLVLGRTDDGAAFALRDLSAPGIPLLLWAV